MASQPIVLSPATPSALLSYIISYHRYPTTLIVGSTRAEFHASLLGDVAQHLALYDEREDERPADTDATSPPHPLLKAPLYQIAISRHIRLLFAPTVTHLRAYLSVFTPKDSPVSPPPNHTPSSRAPLLLIYGLLALHRDA
ncbi:hypothetical protein F66182_11294, partial [Fusarium sp. NRRL 66182]